MTPLASRDDFLEIPGLGILARDMTIARVDRMMIRATRAIEAKCDRRLVPFTITESSRAEGIDTADDGFGGWPLDLIAALGKSEAAAYGSNAQVRDVWLRQYAPVHTDLWAYSNISITLARAIGGTQIVAGTALEGPEPDTGHFRFPLGTFCPVGTTIRVTYTGGYQTVPDDLNTACCYQAAKFGIRFAEPESRQGLSSADLDEVILDLLAPYIRT